MDKLQLCSSIVCSAYHSADGRNIDIEHFLTKETELIADLAKGNSKWGKCDYLLHIIFWTLRDKDCSKILAKIPNENIDLLKDAIAVAQKRKLPDEDEASKISEERKYKSLNPALPMHEKYKNNIIRFSALIDQKVVNKWNTCVKELGKWNDAINGKESEIQISNIKEAPKNTPAPQPVKPTVSKATEKPVETKLDNSELWTMEQLAANMGLKNSISFSQTKNIFLKRHPEAKEKFDNWFIVSPQGKKHFLFKSEFFDDLKKMMYGNVDTSTGNFMTMQELSREFGFKNASSFYWKKTDFLEKHPEHKTKFDDWFVISLKGNKRVFFKSEHLNDLKQLMTPTNKGDFLTTAELARELGLKDAVAFNWKKKDFLKTHPEAKELFDDWFILSSQPHKRCLLLKAEHLDDLKQLMNTKKTKTKKQELKIVSVPDNNLWDTKKLAHELGISVNTLYCKKTALLKIQPTAKEQLNKWFVVSSNDKSRLLFNQKYFEEFKNLLNNTKMPSHRKKEQTQTASNDVKPVQNIPVVEHPSDLVGIKGLEAYLSKLTNLSDVATKERDTAQASYNDLQQKANAEKEKMENSVRQIEQLQQLITTVTGLLTEYNQAKTDLRSAEEKFNQKQTEINNFLQQQSKYLGK